MVSYLGRVGPQDSLVTMVKMVQTLLMIGPLERIMTSHGLEIRTPERGLGPLGGLGIWTPCEGGRGLGPPSSLV